MTEYEHPGVCVEETDAKPKPIEGVPTDALTAADWRRWLIGLVIAAILLVGLGFWWFREPVPSEQLVGRIEQLMADHPCTAALVRRHRDYEYGPTDTAGWRDTTRVIFQLRSGGPVGRWIGPSVQVQRDDGREQVANGYYDVRAKRIVVEYCRPHDDRRDASISGESPSQAIL